MSGFSQELSILGSAARHEGFHAAAEVADAHGAGKGIAVHLTECLNLHGAGKGNQGVCQHVQGLRQQSHRQQQQNFQMYLPDQYEVAKNARLETLEDGTVTIRHRDTMAQERVKIESLHAMVDEECSYRKLFRTLNL